MNISQKLVIADQAILSISRHDDADSVVVKAALDKVIEKVQAEKAAIDERISKKVAAFDE